ncbi:hypothetical protein SOVF_198500 [Spinacia oleracea]|nr:hypothetical protein SOVF_198500 [Spinacia oleracea]
MSTFSSKSTLEPGFEPDMQKCKLESDSESDSEFALEPFHKFFLDWLLVQERDLQELKTMVKTHSESEDSESTQRLKELVDRVMSHYEEFYQARAKSIKENVLLVLTPDWLSKLEDAFLWIGGWRPTTAVHLLYSKAGLQLEARLMEVLNGVNPDDLGNLSVSQLVRVNQVQMQTIAEERKLTEELASHQETLADDSMVELSEKYADLLSEAVDTESDSVQQRVHTTLVPKEHGLEDILRKSDDLRLRTLKNVVDILSPIQALHFLIADTQLHLRVHEWGMLKDEHVRILQQARARAGLQSS